ncbi:restriction endonuclease subunit S [Campylobacter sp. P0103]|uniref:restriction endonuclease subunit S n=1 Tax=Campylobacter sp. P0103 TaxID=1895602 RepID=UPI00191C7932|nr:restriction endonuclease subunit S [Campylobacter sp. P0103]
MSSIEWGEFKLNELFNIERGTRFIKSKRKSGKIPLVTAGEQNQGVAEFIAYDDELKIYENHLTIDMFCNCFYRNYKFLCDDNILVLLPKIDIGNKSLLFMTSAINKDKTKFGYEKQYRQKSFAEHKIKLPITASGEIDFEFMESFVAELEAERVAELEAYLAAASLKDYELTADELSALSKFENYNWGEFRIGDLFEKLNLSFRKSKFNKDNDVSKIKNSEFSIPLVNAKDGDNGIMYYGRPQDFETATMTIDIVNDGAVSTGNVYPQPQETGVLYNAYLIKSKFTASKSLLYFFATAIQKSIKLKFSYELKASWERVKNENIKLPITTNGEIDFEFMNNFIKAIEKLVIKDVVLYTDNKIKATKSIVSSNQ